MMTNPLYSLKVRSYVGDAKVLLCFQLDEKDTADLAGFTIYCQPEGKPAYYLFNQLKFEDPSEHAQVANEPENSSANSPIQKFRWLHIPGNFHNKDNVFFGNYTYVITARYFKDGKLLPIDQTKSVTITTQIKPFSKNGIETGFTRGFTQSQAFITHFGKSAPFKPKKAKLLFDTGQEAGTNNSGEKFTYQDEYNWSGFTARQKVFAILEEVKNDTDLHLDVLAYDLDEPDVMNYFLQFAREGRIRVILDNADLHHDDSGKSEEDQFEQEFRKAVKPGSNAGIKRGSFNRYQHNKILIVSKGQERTPVRMLSGSTNFSVTGMYVNSNHVIVFNHSEITKLYLDTFNHMWDINLDTKLFRDSDFSSISHPIQASDIHIAFTFAPHNKKTAIENLDRMDARIRSERGSILFAVMGVDPKTTGPIPKTLTELHKRDDLFTAGITDTTDGMEFYKPSSKDGIMVTGLPGKTILPPPFCEEKVIGMGHQVHHKFVVCGFNTPDAVVWIGSSNLAQGGETDNGDNLIEIHDQDIATVFALEALALIDHFHFRNKHEAPKKNSAVPKVPNYTLNLGTSNNWCKSYYNQGDLHFVEQAMFWT